MIYCQVPYIEASCEEFTNNFYQLEQFFIENGNKKSFFDIIILEAEIQLDCGRKTSLQ